MKRSIILLAAVAIAASALGQTQPGDVLVAGGAISEAPFLTGKLYIYDHNGSFQRQLAQSPAFGDPAFGPSQVVYVVGNGFVFRFLPNGTTLPPLGPIQNAGSVAPSANGTVYAAGSPHIYEFDRAGALVRTYQLPVQKIDSIDLAADQCTLYYLSAPTIGSINVCTGSALSSLTTSLSSNAGFRLRVQPDGTLLVLLGTGNFQVSTTGTVLRQYTLPGPFAAFDVDPRFVWVVSPTSAQFTRAELDTGTTVIGPIATDLVTIGGVAVVGGWRAALSPSPIPLSSGVALTTLALALCTFALLRLRM